mmetsp:Transcript_15420/g.39271  ORF Transcript_15420/g.39271 Transcript_15420/m.39271 type:complete len:283 (+) Transcript_15420:205-1053(+)
MCRMALMRGLGYRQPSVRPRRRPSRKVSMPVSATYRRSTVSRAFPIGTVRLFFSRSVSCSTPMTSLMMSFSNFSMAATLNMCRTAIGSTAKMADACEKTQLLPTLRAHRRVREKSSASTVPSTVHLLMKRSKRWRIRPDSASRSMPPMLRPTRSPSALVSHDSWPMTTRIVSSCLNPPALARALFSTWPSMISPSCSFSFLSRALALLTSSSACCMPCIWSHIVRSLEAPLARRRWHLTSRASSDAAPSASRSMAGARLISATRRVSPSRSAAATWPSIISR